MNSYWIESTNDTVKTFDKLNRDMKADVCVIGAGITGVSTAYELSKEGKSVIVLDRDNICMSTTANTTAKITSGHDLFYRYLINSFSEEQAKQYLCANEKAIKNIKAIVQKERIECDFEDVDNYVFTSSEKEVENVKDEVNVINELGVEAEFVTESNLPINILGAVKMKNQAQFHPRKYVLGLCNSCLKNDVKIFANTKVYDIKHEGDSYVIYTKDYKVISKYVVLASHYPIINTPGYYFLKMYQEKSYLIGVDVNDKLFDGMYIQVEKPTLSFRTVPYEDRRMLIIGGSDHKVGENRGIEESYKKLEQTAKSIYPNSKVLYRWSTEDCISLDKVPYIGEFSSLMPNMYVATGFKKWGMTTSNIAANIIADKILGRENRYEEVFRSTRFHPLKNHEEMGDMLKQTTKSLIIDKLNIPSETMDDLKDDEGKIIEIEGKKLGVYKKGKEIYKINPICSHLGCELVFNNLEKTWDCPCHGSRFDYTGKSIFEPGIKDLD